MKVENIEKAERLFKMLADLELAIKEAEKMVEKCTKGEAPIYMREYSDGSGTFDVDLIFGIEGNYDSAVYAPIAEFALNTLKDRKLDIQNMIEQL